MAVLMVGLYTGCNM